MKDRIWFVTDGVRPLDCFLSKAAALQNMELYSDEEDYDFYEVYDILKSDLEDYPDEYDLALEEDFI